MAMCLNIIYRALLADHIMIRCIAFIKRLLQITFYMPVPYACGFLIVISKVLQTRKGLFEKVLKPVEPETIKISKKTISKNWMDEEEDGDEVYKDVEYDFDKAEIKKETDSTKKNGKSESSWVHVDNKIDTNVNVVGMDEEEEKPDVTNPVMDDKDVVVKVKKETVFYDPYNRNPLHAGANLSLYVELLKLKDHFHPTVQLFAENIFVGTKIDYDGDPLVDFTCKRFLERFSFKNPKKVDLLNKTVSKKLKLSKGSRGRDVRLLNEFNVTEDERFIFEYLEKQREMKNATRGFKDDESESDDESVDDDEFDDYLDKIAGADKDDLNYMEELGNNLRNPKSKGKQGESDSDDGDDDLTEDQDEKDNEDNDDFDDNDDELEEFDEDDDEDMEQSAGDETLGGNDNFSDLGSDDEDLLNDLGDDDDLSDLEFSDDEPPTKKKKGGKKKNGKEDIASLFANADDFAHLLDEAGASKQKLGTSSAVLNKDKSSDKQLKWEEKRRQNFKGSGKKFGGKKGKKRH
ncbi:CCAAT/enhancer-binding protein zeta-like [Ctenocephalides felis]|uniref:CCAAT/enhancer-binding protein zeta-like n=1 Tax=Ctenocephalides felis TaxID=7515 RepID=UPI000E6E56AF|nr:CCAAT/enhancer-binding protein zeta-like [Ctenocephalides felis]